jgi:hypothetical protein
MDYAILPPELGQLIDPMGSWLDARQRDLWPDLFTGTLLANGPRTATDWFRAADIPQQFRHARAHHQHPGRCHRPRRGHHQREHLRQAVGRQKHRLVPRPRGGA